MDGQHLNSTIIVTKNRIISLNGFSNILIQHYSSDGNDKQNNHHLLIYYHSGSVMELNGQEADEVWELIKSSLPEGVAHEQ